MSARRRDDPGADGEGALPPAGEVARLVATAEDRRAAIARETDAYRAVDDAADGLPGVVVDRYGAYAVLSVSTDGAEARAAELGATLVASGYRGVYAKVRVRADLRRVPRGTVAPETPIAGEPAPADLVVEERGAKYRVALADGLSTGLFTDQRDGRSLVRGAARGARVLNLFAYTCSFSVAAALGGSDDVTSVDLSQRALGRGRDNLALNGVAGAAHRFLRADAPDFVRRARRRGDLYDVVVLDPPSFGTSDRGAFSVERDYARVAEDAVALLPRGGRLLAVTNHRGTTPDDLHALLRAAAAGAGARLASMRDVPTPADHPHRPGGHPRAKSVWLTTG